MTNQTPILRLFAAFLVLAFVAGCSAVQRARVNTSTQEAMNVATDVVDPLYDLAVISCDAAEGVAIARTEDASAARRDITAIRTQCDRIFASFETARQSQLLVREAAEGYQAGTTDFAELLEVVAAAKRIAGTVKELVRTFREEWMPNLENPEVPPANELMRTGATP